MIRLAVDFGSGVTKIYMSGCGVVLMESSCVAVEMCNEGGEKTVNVKAFGDKARALSGRAALNTHIVNPVFEGDIVHERLAAELLAYFFDKIELTPRKARKAQVMFMMPCGISRELQLKYVRLAENLGIGGAYFTFLPFGAILGSDTSISESVPSFSVDIGQSLTNVAVFSQDGMISGMNVNLGGANIDVHIIDYLAENHAVKIGALTAERVKNTVGSLFDDDNKLTVVEGRDITSGIPKSVSVNSEMIYSIITTYVDKILEYVNIVISNLSAEVASSIMQGGVNLTGGLVKMDGLAEYVGKRLSIAVRVSEEPQLAAVIGGGVILNDDILLDKFALSPDMI